MRKIVGLLLTIIICVSFYVPVARAQGADTDIDIDDQAGVLTTTRLEISRALEQQNFVVSIATRTSTATPEALEAEAQTRANMLRSVGVAIVLDTTLGQLAVRATDPAFNLRQIQNAQSAALPALRSRDWTSALKLCLAALNRTYFNQQNTVVLRQNNIVVDDQANVLKEVRDSLPRSVAALPYAVRIVTRLDFTDEDTFDLWVEAQANAAPQPTLVIGFAPDISYGTLYSNPTTLVARPTYQAATSALFKHANNPAANITAALTALAQPVAPAQVSQSDGFAPGTLIWFGLPLVFVVVFLFRVKRRKANKPQQAIAPTTVQSFDPAAFWPVPPSFVRRAYDVRIARDMQQETQAARK